MHAVIIEDLEQYLSGHLPLSVLNRFEAHLAICGECRAEGVGARPGRALFRPGWKATAAQ